MLPIGPCQYPVRSYKATLDKTSCTSRESDFFQLAAELERCRETLPPLHVPFGPNNRPFTQAENQSLADLFFDFPDGTDADFFARALVLLVSRPSCFACILPGRPTLTPLLNLQSARTKREGDPVCLEEGSAGMASSHGRLSGASLDASEKSIDVVTE